MYSDLISKAYDEQTSGHNGIILIGHSLGAAICLSLAAFEGDKLPIIGVSALGIIPTENHPVRLVNMLKADPKNPRLVVESSIEAMETFMGPLNLVDVNILFNPSMSKIFEPGKHFEVHNLWR